MSPLLVKEEHNDETRYYPAYSVEEAENIALKIIAEGGAATIIVKDRNNHGRTHPDRTYDGPS